MAAAWCMKSEVLAYCQKAIVHGNDLLWANVKVSYLGNLILRFPALARNKKQYFFFRNLLTEWCMCDSVKQDTPVMEALYV